MAGWLVAPGALRLASEDPEIKAELERAKAAPDDQLSLLHVVKRYGEGLDPAVLDLSLTIPRGELLALLGHNGAGKSTVIKMICGTEVATYGSIRPQNRAPRIGLCPQSDDLLFENATIRQNIEFIADLGGLGRKQKIATIGRLATLFNLKGALDKRISDLSGGMRRRVSNMMALVGDRPILVFDEPTTGLDPVNRKSVWDVFRTIQEHKTILMSTHGMDEAEALGKRIAILKKGRLEAIGTGAALKKKYQTGLRFSVPTPPDRETEVWTSIVEVLPEAQMESQVSGLLRFFLKQEGGRA